MYDIRKVNWLQVLSITAAIGLAGSSSAFGETLVLKVKTQFTSSQLALPEAFADLNRTFDSIPGNGDVELTIFVPGFESYASGEHSIPLNTGNGLNYGADSETEDKIQTPGLALMLESRLLGSLEGVRTRVPGKGKVVLPDETQLADVGSIRVVDGQVTELVYQWVEPDNPGLKSINTYVVERRKFPVQVESIQIGCEVFSPIHPVGDVAFCVAMQPQVDIRLVPSAGNASISE